MRNASSQIADFACFAVKSVVCASIILEFGGGFNSSGGLFSGIVCCFVVACGIMNAIIEIGVAVRKRSLNHGSHYFSEVIYGIMSIVTVGRVAGAAGAHKSIYKRKRYYDKG